MDLKSAYRTILGDDFPKIMELKFDDGKTQQILRYERVEWDVAGEKKGLRYGENPDQPAALYRLVNGNLRLGRVETILPGRWLVSDAELLQFGKHPGKINLTDVDAGLNILKHLADRPAAAIIKHNNPCGVAAGAMLADCFERALSADRLAAFGGALVVNRGLDMATARAVGENYLEVVAAPEFEPGVVELLSAKKNLRIMRVRDIDRLGDYAAEPFLDFKSLLDGGLVVQTSFISRVRTAEDFLPAVATHLGKEYRVLRPPTQPELEDLVFGWLVETGVTSNSVIYVKDGATVGIGTGEQDRVGVAQIARDKAYRKMQDRIAWERHRKLAAALPAEGRKEVASEAESLRGGLPGSAMISDAFFPFRDGIDVGLAEGVTSVAQPGGSLRDFESIEACNEHGAAMVFTGQRCFRH